MFESAVDCVVLSIFCLGVLLVCIEFMCLVLDHFRNKPMTQKEFADSRRCE